MKKFVFAPQERIDMYESTAREFFRAVLDLDYCECVVTDESRLADFASCGIPDDLADATDSLAALYEAWDAWVVPIICSRYRVVDVSPTVLLVDLFEQIEAVRRRVLQ
jgi:hypothetical protein